MGRIQPRPWTLTVWEASGGLCHRSRRTLSALPRTVAARLPGRRACGPGCGLDGRPVTGASAREPGCSAGDRAAVEQACRQLRRAPLRHAGPHQSRLRENFCVSAEQEGGTQEGPGLHGYGVPAGAACSWPGRAAPSPWQPPALLVPPASWALPQIAAVREAYGAKRSHLHRPCGEDRSLPFYFFRKCYQMCW